MEIVKTLGDYGDILTPKELQDILGVGRCSVYKLLSTGAIKSVRVGTMYRIPKAYITDFMYPNREGEEG